MTGTGVERGVAGGARYRWTVLRAGRFSLDGGSMFGLIPRAVWSRGVAADEKGRIAVQHNCLLLERVGEAAAGAPGRGLESPKLVLIETGTGDKLDGKNRDVFAMEERSVLDALHERDCRAEDVGAVVVTHLHFDHAGGLTRLARAGETPDWRGAASSFGAARGEHGVKRSFPGAAVHVQALEWRDALENRSVMTRTYFADHLAPVAEQVRLADSPRAFPSGYRPGREETPAWGLETRWSEVVSGVRVFLVAGHTWGQQAVHFTDERGREVVFTPDVMPTAAHVGAAYSLAYDVEAYTTMVSKRWFLGEAADRGWTLVLDHEAGDPVRRVRRTEAGAGSGSGWFELIEGG